MADSERILYGSEKAQIQEREDSLDFFPLFSFNVSFVYLRSFRELALMNPYSYDYINIVVVVVFIPDVAIYVHVAVQGVLDPDLLPCTPEL